MAKTIEFKQFDIMSVAKINGVLGVVIGLFIGILFAFISTASVADAGWMATLGYLNIIVMPIMYGIMYFIGGLIFAAIYNIIAKKIGGIKVKI